MTVDLHSLEIKPLRNTYTQVAKYAGENRPASRYLEATIGGQSMQNYHYRPTWDSQYQLFDTRRTAIKLADWNVLRDPRQFYYGVWATTRARQQDATEANYRFVESRDLVARASESVRAQALSVLVPLRHAAWGGNMNNCFVAAYGYGAAFTAPASFHAMDQLGVAQLITRMALALGGPESIETGKNEWMDKAEWQALRRYIEDMLVLKDPFELFVAQNLALDGLLYPLIFNQFIDENLTVQGGTAVTLMLSFIPEWATESARWIDATLKIAAAESKENQELTNTWTSAWLERAEAALSPVAQMAFGNEAKDSMEQVRSQMNARLSKAGLAL